MTGRSLHRCGIGRYLILFVYLGLLLAAGLAAASKSHGGSHKKHGKHGGGNSLEKRLSYKHGEFRLTRHPEDKLYPSSGPMFAHRGNLAVMKHVTQSSYKPGHSPLAAVDGDPYAFHEEVHSYAATKLERNPWIHVTLSDSEPVSVASIEVWFPTRKCEQYLKNISLDEKKRWLAAVKTNTTHKMPWRCQYRRGSGPLFYQPSKAAPLELAFKVGENVVARRTVAEPMSVVTWDVEREFGTNRKGDGVEGDGVEGDSEGGLVATSVLIRAKGKVQLSAAEVKVFGPEGTVRCGLATCRHGSCKKSGDCACLPDWIGADCSVNIRGDTKYLPERPEKRWWDKRATQSFEQKASELRGEEYCRDSISPHLLPGPAGLGAGLGSTFYFRCGHFSQAMKANRGYNSLAYFNYARNSWCKEAGKFGEFSCYFEENANCTRSVEQKRSKIRFPALTQKNAKGQDCLLPHDECKVTETFNDIPREFAKKGIFWWRSHQIHSLFRLNDKVKELLDLEALKASINFTHPIIGVHIRSGDGCRHGVRSRLFRCRTLSEYLPDINTLSSKYRTKNVFIATDNPAILAEIERSKGQNQTDLNFVVVPSDFRSQLQSDVKIEQRMTDAKLGKGFDAHGAIMSALTDIHLLAQCDFLVTHQASTMSRIALNLATMNKRHIPPFISLDGPWCPQWRMCCEPRHDTGQYLVC